MPNNHDGNLIRARKQLELMAEFYGFNTPDYFIAIDNHIAAYLEATNLGVLFKDFEVDAIFVYNHSPYYPGSLAFMLIGMNDGEIHKCLDYHKEQYKEVASFNLLLIDEALNHFNTFSPFSNDERLTIIKEWLEK